MDDRTVLGAFEHIGLPEFDISEVLAKVDTGAYSGALHCSVIRLIDPETLEFALFDNPEKLFTTTSFARKTVRSASGHSEQRYVIDTKICVTGQTYQCKIGLSDRSKMKYDVLLGRRFLREHNFLVDVRLNQAYDIEMGQQT